MPIVCEWCKKLIAPTKIFTINVNGTTRYICAECKEVIEWCMK